MLLFLARLLRADSLSAVIRERDRPPMQWWTTSPKRRPGYVFVAFPPRIEVAQVMEWAADAIGEGPEWGVVPDPEGDGADLRCWRHETTGALVSLVAVGYMPLVVMAAPFGPDGRSGTGLLSLPGHSAARQALARWSSAALARGGRQVPARAVPVLLMESAGRHRQVMVRQRRMEQLADEDETRACPACEALTAADARRCPRCEREFDLSDGEKRDRDALARKKAAGRAAADLERLTAEAFPSAAAPFIPASPPRRYGSHA